MKKTLWMVFLICAGIVAGSLTGDLTAGISWLSWLSFSLGFGLTSPFVLDIGVITLTFAFTFNLSVAVILFISIALFIGIRVRL